MLPQLTNAMSYSGYSKDLDHVLRRLSTDTLGDIHDEEILRVFELPTETRGEIETCKAMKEAAEKALKLLDCLL